MENNTEYYTTRHLPMAAALSLQFEVIKIGYSNQEWNKLEFYFASTPQLHEAIQRFKDKELEVEPNGYYLALINLRKMMNEFLTTHKT